MATEHTVENFIGLLADEGRILLIGGLAVIAHGLSRATKDADIWLEPFEDENIWSEKVNKICAKFERSALFDVFENKRISCEQLPLHIYEKDMIRINGLERPLDIFREPNNLNKEDFEIVWKYSSQIAMFRVLDPLYLIQTKMNTERKQDKQDLTFLEALITEKYVDELKKTDYARAKEIFTIYADYKLCGAALGNPDQKVRELALDVLKDCSSAGDPFAQEILDKFHYERGSNEKIS